MKRIISFLLTITIFLIPSVVNADTMGFDLTCEGEGAYLDELTCAFKVGASDSVEGQVNSLKAEFIVPDYVAVTSINNTSEFSALKGKISYTLDSKSKTDDTFQTITIEKLSGNETKYNNNQLKFKIKLYKEEYYKDTFKIGLYLHSLNTTPINFKDEYVYSDDITIRGDLQNKLSSLKIENEQLEFNPNIESYSLTTNNSYIIINGNVIEDASTNFNLKNNKIDLKYGQNKIEIPVVNKLGTKRTYVINVNREENKSNNTNIKSLSINDNEIKIKKGIYEYKVDLDYEQDTLDINYELEDDKATLDQVGNKDLKVGENKIKIIVTAENEEKKEYTIIVNRKEKELSKDTGIKSLEIKNIKDKINFTSDNSSYIIKINKKITKLDFDIQLNDENASFEILDNKDIKENTRVIVKVTAEDKSTKDYIFYITYEENNNKTIIIIIVILIALITCGIITFFVIKKKKKGKKVSNNTANDVENKEEDNLQDNDNSENEIVINNEVEDQENEELESESLKDIEIDEDEEEIFEKDTLTDIEINDEDDEDDEEDF